MSKTVIIGGVAGGASCAARLRRLDGDREIIILERGKYISYANCGLPYHVSGVISNRSSLLLMTPELMHDRFRIDVRVENEVTKIDRSDKTVTVKDLSTGRTYTESYNELVIATGSSPLRPRIKGIASDKIRTLWTVPDTDEIRALVQNGKTKTAAVIGGGFIGLEMVENLRHAGLEVSLIEAADQVMALLDFEMAQVLHETIRRNGIALYLSDGVSEFEDMGSSVNVKLQSGKSVTSDLVILAIGVRPNSVLAKDAGLKCNERGGVVVDDHMRTSDKSIYAVGDVIEVEDFISKERTMVPLAGPANKQGRIAADVIAGRDSAYKGTQGSSVAKVFDLTAASTGANEKILNKRGLKKHKDYETLIITQNSHAGYYPGALPLTLKLIFECGTSKILGAQIVGRDGVDKRIDTIGTAIRFGGTTDDLKNLELAYAPPYSSAKDPVNMAGFVAENIRAGLVNIADVSEASDKKALLLDVREEAETMAYSIPNALNIPLGKLRDNLDKIDRSKKIIVFCAVGVRAYNGARILMQNGFENVKIFPGGVRFYQANFPNTEDAESAPIEKVEVKKAVKQTENVNKITLDC